MEQVFQSLQPEFAGKIAFIHVNVYNPAERELISQYSFQYIPTTFFLNGKGEITFTYVGEIKVEEMRSKLKDLAEAK